MMPHPPGARLTHRNGGGFTTSNARNNTNATAAMGPDETTGGVESMIAHIAHASSITTADGSIVPQRRSAAVEAATPMRNPAATQTSSAAPGARGPSTPRRSEEHTSELQSQSNLVCRLLLEKK